MASRHGTRLQPSHAQWNRRLLMLMIGLGGLLGCAILGDAIYLIVSGERPIYEDGRLAHGFYQRLSGFVVIAHSLLFYIGAVRMRQPEAPAIPGYILSLAATLLASLMAFDGSWKHGFGTWSLVVLGVAMLLTIIAILFGSRARGNPRETGLID